LLVTAGSTDWCCISLTLSLLLIRQGSGRVGQMQVALPLDLIHRIKTKQAHLVVAVAVVAVAAAAVVVVAVVVVAAAAAAAVVVVIVAAAAVIRGR
jgi:archaellum biogenesis protein FlaJ (TadC family)